MIERLKELAEEARRRIADAADERELEEARVACLGRKSEINQAARGLGKLPEDERREAGKALNQLKAELEGLLEEARERISSGGDSERAGLDVTLPGRAPWVGRRHPLKRTFERLERIFLGLGFQVAEGPHVEDEFHNFDALNIPAEHPSRDAWDTFYLEGGMLLRTHTSPVQIREMQSRRPPIRIIAPGRVFRNETPDASHAAEFYQLEGLAVGSDIRFGELKGVLTSFLHELFGPDVGVRFRAGFFPFTEPSTEVDIACVVCGGDGCPVCKRTGWVELLGAGMVDPRVFEAVGYDPDEVSGYAFGLGVDRICMMLSGMDDIRLLLENDIRFLRTV
ncbi:MAG: phenylalanine--tRNA ligase subunit alpha [Candidatus Eisenbacteria bacterium]|nr:phenylalanine--tRNA ligase subunit alpha [Candidatus Eisenbacteria bacterium]